MSLLELTFAGMLLSTVLLTVMLFSGRSIERMSTIADVGGRSDLGMQALHRLERLLRGATAVEPRAFLSQDVSKSDDQALVSGLRGFPDRDSWLILAPTTSDFELVRYSTKGVVDSQPRMWLTVRGWGGGSPRNHDAGDIVRWWPLAVSVGGAERNDGLFRELNGSTPFRGGGNGFVYQVPVELPGVVQRELGATVAGQAVSDGMNLLRFRSARVIDEARLRQDLNGDGDRSDRFDIGLLSHRTWADDLPLTPLELPMSAAIIVQQVGAWGSGDLDGDGFSDPIFFWDRERDKLAISLTILLERGQQRRFETLRGVVRLGRGR